MTKDKVNQLLRDNTFRFAKSMPRIPHSYTLKNTWESGDDFIKVVKFINANGVKEKFYSRTFTYYYANGYKYWSMADSVGLDIEETILINRAKQ